MCSGAWPLNESEAGVDLVFIEPSSFCYVNDAVLMLISRNLQEGFFQNKVNSSLTFIQRPGN